VILSLPSGIRLLPAGEERLRRALERGLDGDDPALPVRTMAVLSEGRTLSVAVGPIDYEEPDSQLWEFVLEIR